MMAFDRLLVDEFFLDFFIKLLQKSVSQHLIVFFPLIDLSASENLPAVQFVEQPVLVIVTKESNPGKVIDIEIV